MSRSRWPLLSRLRRSRRAESAPAPASTDGSPRTLFTARATPNSLRVEDAWPLDVTAPEVPTGEPVDAAATAEGPDAVTTPGVPATPAVPPPTATMPPPATAAPPAAAPPATSPRPVPSVEDDLADLAAALESLGALPAPSPAPAPAAAPVPTPASLAPTEPIPTPAPFVPTERVPTPEPVAATERLPMVGPVPTAEPGPVAGGAPPVAEFDAPTGPTRVHPDRLLAPSGPVELTPSQAIHLAQDGPEVLTRPRPKAR